MKLQPYAGKEVETGSQRAIVPRLSDLISPAGAILALVCFFLPWGRFSCAGHTRVLSGAQIGGIFWIVFGAAIAIPAVVLVGVLLERHGWARCVVAVCSLIALAVIVVKQIEFIRGHETGFGRVSAADVGVRTRFGGAGTVLGLLVALAGSMRVGPRSRRAGTPRRTPQP